MTDDVPPIETDRLRLHSLGGDHRPGLRRLLGDPQVLRFSLSGPLDPFGVDAWLERHRAADPRYGFRAVYRHPVFCADLGVGLRFPKCSPGCGAPVRAVTVGLDQVTPR